VRTLLCVVALAALMMAAPVDIDLSGKWTGTFNIQGPDGAMLEQGAIVMNLKQTGAALTGTIGPSEEEQLPIVQGKVEGDKVTIEVKRGEMAVKVDLTLTGERLKGGATLTGERPATAKIDAGRAK
jgi:hypothetical protein